MLLETPNRDIGEGLGLQWGPSDLLRLPTGHRQPECSVSQLDSNDDIFTDFRHSSLLQNPNGREFDGFSGVGGLLFCGYGNGWAGRFFWSILDYHRLNFLSLNNPIRYSINSGQFDTIRYSSINNGQLDTCTRH